MYERIRNSIETLTDTTIYNRYSGGLYDIGDKRYVVNENEGYHIIEHFKSYTFKDAKKNGEKRVRAQEVRDHTMVRLNKFFYKSIANSYFKYFNYETFKSLQSGVARKLFLLLNKWKGDNACLKVKYETLYERIPLDDSIPRFRRNETLKEAGEQLMNAGFVTNIVYERDLIKYYFSAQVLPENVDIASYKKRYCTIADVCQGLLDFGLTEEEAQKVLGTHLADLRYLKALLRYVYILQRYGKIHDNPKGYLLKGLDERYEIDEKYYDVE